MRRLNQTAPTGARGPFASLVPSCRARGIGKTTAHRLAREGLVETFVIGRRRYVLLASLDGLPSRLAEMANEGSQS